MSERSVWKAWASDNFRVHALERAQDIFKAKLLTSHPADEVVSEFLPEGATFFSNITSRLSDAEPIASVRRAFPGYFPSEPVRLAGTTPASGAQARTSSGSNRAQNSGGASSTGSGRKRDGPGSKADLAKVLASGHLFLAGKVCDINSVADTLKVKVDDHCWPVLFSTKKGDEALSLCPCPDRHGGLKSRWHKPPKGFNKEQLTKKFFTAANADQLREAGWKTSRAKT